MKNENKRDHLQQISENLEKIINVIEQEYATKKKQQNKNEIMQLKLEAYQHLVFPVIFLASTTLLFQASSFFLDFFKDNPKSLNLASSIAITISALAAAFFAQCFYSGFKKEIHYIKKIKEYIDSDEK